VRNVAGVSRTCDKAVSRPSHEGCAPAHPLFPSDLETHVHDPEGLPLTEVGIRTRRDDTARLAAELEGNVRWRQLPSVKEDDGG
jgi:hypothetical protein